MDQEQAQNVPKTKLAVARGVGVPVGQRLESIAQPGPLGDEGGQSNIGHVGFCGWVGGWVLREEGVRVGDSFLLVVWSRRRVKVQAFGKSEMSRSITVDALLMAVHGPHSRINRNLGK